MKIEELESLKEGDIIVIPNDAYWKYREGELNGYTIYQVKSVEKRVNLPPRIFYHSIMRSDRKPEKPNDLVPTPGDIELVRFATGYEKQLFEEYLFTLGKQNIMEKYLGVKIVHAEPMSSVEATAQRLHTRSMLEDGYKVVYEDGYSSWSPKEVFEKAYRPIGDQQGDILINVNLNNGEWKRQIINRPYESPVAIVMDDTKTENLTFGEAIESLKYGKSIARAGWNGKSMSLYLNKGSFDGELLGFKPGDKIFPKHMSTIDGVCLGLFEYGNKGTVTRLPNIRMVTASGSIVEGWLASQTDILAEDWMIVE